MSNRQSSDAEWEVLQVMWRHGPATVRRVDEILNKPRKVGYSTPLKRMRIMTEKDLLKRSANKRSHVYSAVIRESVREANQMKQSALILCFLIFALPSIYAQKADFPELTGPYLGQTPPDERPVEFAPGIVSTGRNHSAPAISPDGKEFYWAAVTDVRKLWRSRMVDGRWTVPEILPFCKDDGHGYDNPFVTPDGGKLFFTIYRKDAAPEDKETIWFCKRTASGWSRPAAVSPALNKTPLHWSISVSTRGTLYFQYQDMKGKGKGGIGDIYYSRMVDGEYTAPVDIGPIINTPATETCPHIAPDESYLVFTRFDQTNVRNTGIFISYRDRDGNWLPPVIAEGGTKKKGGLSPRISPDGKYLFYVNGGLFWMRATFIEKLRPQWKGEVEGS